MKFAQELDEALVSVWRDKYVDYKSGKRLVKAVHRAVNRINGVSDPREFLLSPFHFPRKEGRQSDHGQEMEEITPLRASAAELEHEEGKFAMLSGRTLNERGDQEQSSINSPADEEAGNARVLFEDGSHAIEPGTVQKTNTVLSSLTSAAVPSHSTRPSVIAHAKVIDTPKPGGLRRFPTGFGISRVATQAVAIHMHPMDLLNLRKQEFTAFLDAELEKVETFYRQKEEEAGKRLQALRQQLEIMQAQRHEESAELRGFSLISQPVSKIDEDNKQGDRSVQVKSKSIVESVNIRNSQTQRYAPVPSETSLATMHRDHVRRPVADQKVSYRSAKAKLRIAIHELFRGLEFLSAYTLLNRTAFRKLNKKFDKAIDPLAKPTLEWFNARIHSSYFATSHLVDEYVDEVEGLYAHYLERGNQKLAVGKLRQLTEPKGDKSASALLNGLMVGVGLTFAVEGLWLGGKKLFDEDDDVREQTAFLLQIYAGYFLMLYLFSWFCFNCRTWSNNKVNYPFIFEFDTRHDLDWRQLSNFPCFFTLLFGVIVWFNFTDFGFEEDLFLWYPIILVGLSTLIVLLPLPLFRWRSRRWFAIAHWRLLLSGLYPVEFRDFFLGDMYCSLTYAITNLELFFCLYVNKWGRPARCGSKNSWLVALFAAIPPLWRLLQCLRRFWDTKSAFPHLANFFKYGLAIVATVMLSLYRMQDTSLALSLFVSFASLSAFYSALWDIFMDFSLIQGGRYPGLREILAFDKIWLYYGIMFIDPVLRFSWILTLLFAHSIQHGTYVAFVVAFVEATRRGMWTLFRVENEHCTNVKILKASRDVPLPYKILPEHKETGHTISDGSFTLLSVRSNSEQQSPPIRPTTPSVEAGGYNHSHSHSRSPKVELLRSISRKLGQAHRQDFQKSKTISEEEEDVTEVHGRGQGIQKALLDDDEESDHESVHYNNHNNVDTRDDGSRRGSDSGSRHQSSDEVEVDMEVS